MAIDVQRISSRELPATTLPVFPAAGGRTVERRLCASLRLRTVGGCPRQPLRLLYHRQTWTTRLKINRTRRKKKGGGRKKKTHQGPEDAWSTVHLDVPKWGRWGNAVTFFPLDPSHVMSRGAGASLVSQNGLQVIVTAVVGAHICRRSWGLTALNRIGQARTSALARSNIPSGNEKGWYFTSLAPSGLFTN